VADYVTAANLALAKVGEAYRILDPLEDSHPARIIAPVFAAVRRAVLRKGKFNFSMTRAELAAQAASDPGYRSPYPYANRFPVPADFVRLVELLGPPECVETYKYESKAVLADTVGPVFVRYVRDVPEIGDWDDLFVEAFAARLGFEICDVLTGDRARRGDCWNEFQKLTKDAASSDAKEDPPIEAYDSSWVTARPGASERYPQRVALKPGRRPRSRPASTAASSRRGCTAASTRRSMPSRPPRCSISCRRSKGRR
jgi:hypothetical protein